MTEFKTDISKKYELNFTTDEEDNYNVMQDAARKLIDGRKLHVLTDEEYEHLCACEIDYANLYKVFDDLLEDLYQFSKGIKDVSCRLQCDYIRNKAEEAKNVL